MGTVCPCCDLREEAYFDRVGGCFRSRVQVKSVEGAGADSAATNGGQVFYVHGDYFGTSDHTPGRLTVTYGPNMTAKYTAGKMPCVVAMDGERAIHIVLFV